MTFTSDIPVSGDTLGSTRDRVRGNFQETAAVFAINHVPFNTTGKGKHNFLQMPIQSSDPTTLANEAGFYSKLGANPAEPNLWFRGQSDGFEYQLTHADQANIATFSNYTVYNGAKPNQSGGWTFLAGGLIMFYGKNLMGSGTSTSVTYPFSFTTLFSVTITAKTDPTRLSSETTSGFSILHNTGNSGVRFYWQAIGEII